MPLMASNGRTAGDTPKCAWVTLLTRSSYLPGVITLAYSLSTHQSVYPLVVLVTPSLPASSVRALELESIYNPLLKVLPIEPLLPSNNQKTTLIASRFEDTWTKLRAFELTSYDACVFLDADITIYKNMDEIFSIRLPGENWIAATHACVCNLDHDSWAPANWKRENCAYTRLKHPSALERGVPVPPSSTPPDTYALLNGGVFLYHPSKALWRAMHHNFLSSYKLSSYQFPDQDFLASFFCHRWLSLPWKFNALKTMKQWHANVWRDSEVRALHYIVDKPWEKRVASDRIAGHLGRDGVTHDWWWDVWEDWRGRRSRDLTELVDRLVAEPLDDEADRKQCEENRRKGFPMPLPLTQ